MATRFASLRDDDVDSRALERNRFIHGGGGTGQCEPARLDLVARCGRQHAEREAEDGRAAVKGRIELLRRNRAPRAPAARASAGRVPRKTARLRATAGDGSTGPGNGASGTNRLIPKGRRRLRPHGCAEIDNLLWRQIRIRANRSSAPASHTAATSAGVVAAPAIGA